MFSNIYAKKLKMENTKLGLKKSLLSPKNLEKKTIKNDKVLTEKVVITGR